METTPHTFLSTLAQITVTTVVLLVSGIIAFTVYKKERKISYDDAITKERINIRSYLRDINSRWNITYEFYIPLEFESEYKSLIKDKTSMELWTQALIATQFEEIGQRTDITKAFEQKAPDYLKNDSWIYPLKLFIVSKIINIINRKHNIKSANPKEIFPVAISEIGYEEWERDFKLMYSNRSLIEQLVGNEGNSRFITGLKAYITKVNDSEFAEYYSQGVLNNINDFLSNADKINESIKLIQEKEFIANTSYSIELNPFWIILFVCISIILGIITPLFTINYNIKIAPIVGLGLLTLTIASLVFSFVIFAKQITNPILDTSYEYLVSRRYKPLIDVLKEHSEFIDKYKILDLSFLYDFKLDGKIEGIGDEKIKKISIYIDLVETYNSTTYDFSDLIKTTFRNEFDFIKLSPFKEGFAEFPSDLWFNQEKRTSYFKRVLKNKSNIGFNISSSFWTRDLVWLPCGKWEGSEDGFINSINNIVEKIHNSLMNKKYFEIIKNLKALNSSMQLEMKYD